MQKKYLIFLLSFLFLCNNHIIAQGKSEAPSTEIDTTSTKAKIKKWRTAGDGVKTWQVNGHSGVETQTQPDTLMHNYQLNTTLLYKNTIAAEWLGNMGSPSQSAIFNQRHFTSLTSDYIFRTPYLSNYLSPDKITFYNTKIPYSNLSYSSGYISGRPEEHLTGIFSVNANKRLNFGLTADYIYAHGAYMNLSTDDLFGAINGSYRDDRYSIYFIAAINNFRNYENGGIADDSYLESADDASNIPVNLQNAWSVYNSFYFWINQQYIFGYDKVDKNDSDKKNFVPLMTLGYTTKYENSQKLYLEKQVNQNFYQNSYYSTLRTRDTTANHFFENVISLTFNEGAYDWAKFGIRAFAEIDVENNTFLIADSVLYSDTRALIGVGGEIFKRKGKTTWGVLGRALLLGSEGRLAFEVTGDFKTQIPINNDVLNISAFGHIKSNNPSYFTEQYYSNHFQWDNTFNNTWSAQAYGQIGIPYKYVDFSVGAGWQGIKNYIYFNKEALPEQNNTDFIQVISADLKLNLSVWLLHLENQVSFQMSTKPDILPLPMISLYSNFYIQHAFFKRLLNFQLGVDCRYNTAYYANAYMPATGQFHIQNETLVGNYPVMNIYLNIHLKQFRFFIMYYNLSATFMPKTYFTTPHYPINPGLIKIGMSWNFYD